jgi:hypothetical protein
MGFEVVLLLQPSSEQQPLKTLLLSLPFRVMKISLDLKRSNETLENRLIMHSILEARDFALAKLITPFRYGKI